MEPPQKRCKQETPPGLRHLQSPAETPSLPTGAHKVSKAGARTLQRLQSVERVFCSQTLDTPGPLQGLYESGAKGFEGNCSGGDCDFIISYSQNYKRLPSYTLTEEEIGDEGECAGAGPSSWESEANHFSLPAAADEHTTPELCPQPGGGTPQTRKFFPLFRPKSEWKTIHIIRHGESEYNAATASRDIGFADPQIFDPKLTTKGRRQAASLRAQLEAMKLRGDALWVVSPLTRALETLMLACPQAHKIGSSDQPLNLVVHGLLSEQCMTTGDVGLPASTMRHKFPQFTEALRGLPERWWFRADENDAQEKRFGKSESKKQMRARVGEFRRWAQSRPERVIIAVGHNCLFKELTNGQKSLRNCELHTMSI